jgi:hypothetical protein
MRGRTQALEALFAPLEGIPDKSTNAAEIRGTAAVAGRKGVPEYTPIFGTCPQQSKTQRQEKEAI